MWKIWYVPAPILLFSVSIFVVYFCFRSIDLDFFAFCVVPLFYSPFLVLHCAYQNHPNKMTQDLITLSTPLLWFSFCVLVSLGANDTICLLQVVW